MLCIVNTFTKVGTTGMCTLQVSVVDTNCFSWIRIWHVICVNLYFVSSLSLGLFCILILIKYIFRVYWIFLRWIIFLWNLQTLRRSGCILGLRNLGIRGNGTDPNPDLQHWMENCVVSGAAGDGGVCDSPPVWSSQGVLCQGYVPTYPIPRYLPTHKVIS